MGSPASRTRDRASLRADAVLLHRRWAPHVVGAVLLVGSVVLARATLVDGDVSLLNPAAGLTACWVGVAATARGRVRVTLAAVAVGLLTYLLTSAEPVVAVCFALSHATHGLVAAAVLRHRTGGGAVAPSTRHLRDLVAAAALASVAGALVGPGLLGLLTGTVTQAPVLEWALRNAVSTVLLGGVALGLLAAARARRAGVEPAGPAGRVEQVLVFGVSGVVYLFVFVHLVDVPLSFAVLPLCVWAGLRLSTTGAALHAAVAGATVVVAASWGMGPFALQGEVAAVVMAEAFVLTDALLTLALALHRDEREELLRQAAGARARADDQAALLEDVIATLGEGVAVLDAHGRSVPLNAAAHELVPVQRGGSLWTLLDHWVVTDGEGRVLTADEVPAARALRGEDVVDVDLVLTPAGGAAAAQVVSVSARPLRRGTDGGGSPRAGGVVVAYHDVTAVRRSAAEAAETRDLFAGVLGATEQSIVGTDREGRITVFNRGAERITGWRAAEVLGLPCTVVHDRQELVARAAAVGLPPEAALRVVVAPLEGERSDSRRWTYRRRDGGAVPVSLTVTALHGPDGAVSGYLGVAEDLTDRLEAERRLADSVEMFRAGFESAPLGMALVELSGARAGRMTQVNGALEELAGLPTSGLVGSTLVGLAVPGQAEPGAALATLQEAAAAGRRGTPARCDVVVRRGDGSRARWALTASVVLSSEGAASALCLLEDVTDRREAEERLRHDALHDALTGLPGRELLLQRLQAEVSGAVADVGVLFVDLDGFKAVNDSAGHAVGDDLLRLVAQRLRSAVREGDLVARLSGDEFALVVGGTGGASGLVAVGRRCVETLSRPCRLSDGPHHIGASVGARVLRPGDEPGQALREADAAMYEAKRAGRGRVVLAGGQAVPRPREDALPTTAGPATGR